MHFALLLAKAAHSSKAANGRRLQEIGFIVAGLGAIALIVVGGLGLSGGREQAERYAIIVAGLLLGVGFLLGLLGLHTG